MRSGVFCQRGVAEGSVEYSGPRTGSLSVLGGVLVEVAGGNSSEVKYVRAEVRTGSVFGHFAVRRLEEARVKSGRRGRLDAIGESGGGVAGNWVWNAVRVASPGFYSIVKSEDSSKSGGYADRAR